MRHTRFTAGLIAFALAVSAFAAAPARADERDVVRALGGMLAIYAIGSALSNRAEAKPAPSANRWTPPARSQGRWQDHLAIPERCVSTARIQNGRWVAVASERCILDARRSAHPLPGACEVRVQAQHGRRDAYALGCLQNKGFRVVADNKGKRR